MIGTHPSDMQCKAWIIHKVHETVDLGIYECEIMK